MRVRKFSKRQFEGGCKGGAREAKCNFVKNLWRSMARENVRERIKLYQRLIKLRL